MAEDNLVRRAARANIRSYYVGIAGLLVMVYGTFLQHKPSDPIPPKTEVLQVGSSVPSSSATRYAAVRDRVMQHTQGIGIALILIGMLSSAAVHLVASGWQWPMRTVAPLARPLTSAKPALTARGESR